MKLRTSLLWEWATWRFSLPGRMTEHEWTLEKMKVARHQAYPTAFYYWLIKRTYR